MNRFLISGAEKTTGKDVRVELEAVSETEAREAAVQEGILITECKALDAGKTALSRNDAYLRESVMWLRFLGITAALGVFAVAVKLILTH